MEGSAAPSSNGPGVPREVLVVDDEDDIRRALQEILEGEGYATAGASNGVEALEWLKARSVPPSLILLDLMMPEMDGWDLLACIDEDRRLHRIPVALMSAHPSVRRAFDKHRDEERPRRLLFPKPLNILRLLATVRYFCSDDVCRPPDGLDCADDGFLSIREAPTAKFRPLRS